MAAWERSRDGWSKPGSPRLSGIIIRNDCAFGLLAGLWETVIPLLALQGWLGSGVDASVRVCYSNGSCLLLVDTLPLAFEEGRVWS